jgi:hypothetical protein
MEIGASFMHVLFFQSVDDNFFKFIKSIKRSIQKHAKDQFEKKIIVFIKCSLFAGGAVSELVHQHNLSRHAQNYILHDNDNFTIVYSILC